MTSTAVLLRRRTPERHRRMLAEGFASALRAAQDPHRGLSARVPVDRVEVRYAERDLKALCALLRDVDTPMTDEQIRLADRLLTDGSGPLFVCTEPGALRHRVRTIIRRSGNRRPTRCG